MNSGAFKHKASAFEGKDDPNAETRRTIRTAKELVDFGRAECHEPAHDFYSKKGGGAYRRFYHHIPMKGSGSISRFRRLVKGCESAIKERHSGAKQLISKLHRVVNDGYEGFLMASDRATGRPAARASKTITCSAPHLTRPSALRYRSTRRATIGPLLLNLVPWRLLLIKLQKTQSKANC